MSAVRIATAAMAAALLAGASGGTDGAWRPAPPVRWTPAPVSTAGYESSPFFSEDGMELWHFRADREFRNYRLLRSRCIAGRWTPSDAPPFAAAGSAEADPSLSPDGRRLYFVSARPPGSADDFDIWLVERDAGGAWSAPRRLPEPVNSPASELLPRELADGRLLFGSSRPGGHGHGDIYLATPQPGGGWRVDNAGPPVSTPANEYEADMSRDGSALAVVADRGDRSHLYLYARRGDGWVESGRVPARDDVFQVGPLLSPTGDRLLFAQADGADSGEWFLADLRPDPDPRWPPSCDPGPGRASR